jgi:glycoside transferase family 2
MDSSTHPLVSVVIPIYKAEATLPSCIDSLIGQSYRPLELLFVDDCSPDRGADIVIARTPELQAEGIQVQLLRHPVNQGVATARNTALGAATGDYVYSVDADDELAPSTIELLVQRALSERCDLVGCEWLLKQGTSTRPMTQPDVHTGQEALEQCCRGLMRWNLWLFLIKRSLIETPEPLRFLPGMNMGEDMMLMGKLFLRASRVSIIHQPLYTYVRNDSSLTSSYTPQNWEQVDANLRELERYIECEDKGSEVKELLQYLKLNLKLPLLITGKRQDYDRWLSSYTEAHPFIARNSSIPFRTRLLQQMAARRQYWFVVLYDRVIMQWLYKLLYH